MTLHSNSSKKPQTCKISNHYATYKIKKKSEMSFLSYDNSKSKSSLGKKVVVLQVIHELQKELIFKSGKISNFYSLQLYY